MAIRRNAPRARSRCTDGSRTTTSHTGCRMSGRESGDAPRAIRARRLPCAPPGERPALYRLRSPTRASGRTPSLHRGYRARCRSQKCATVSAVFCQRKTAALFVRPGAALRRFPARPQAAASIPSAARAARRGSRRPPRPGSRRSLATTGVPSASASRIGRPKPSARLGKTSAPARLSSAQCRLAVGFANEPDAFAVGDRRCVLGPRPRTALARHRRS